MQVWRKNRKTEILKKETTLNKRNPDISLKELEQRKKRIEAELNQIHKDFDSSIDSVKRKVAGGISPGNFIRKYPFKALGISVIAGFALGLKRRKASGKKIDSHVTDKPGVTSMIFEELKSIAARRAVQLVMDVVDDKISGRRKSGDKPDISDEE